MTAGARSGRRGVNRAVLTAPRRPGLWWAVAPAAVPRREGRLAGLLVLVAEDHPDSLDALRQLLESEGAEVLATENGAAALRRLEGSPRRPDIVLVDLMMPVLDGFQLARRIRTEARWAAIPLVAVTARVETADYDATLEAGFAAHVPKPIDLEALIAVLLRVYAGPTRRVRPGRARRRRPHS